MKSIFVFALALAVSSPAAFADKKSAAQYWTDTGLTTQQLATQKNLLVADDAFTLTDPLLSQKNCLKNSNNFQGCFMALNAILMDSNQQILPASLASDKTMNVAKVIKNYPALTLVQQARIPDSTSFKDFIEQDEARRAKTEAAIAALFKTRNAKKIDFAGIYLELVKSVEKDPSFDAELASNSVTAYLSRAVDAHSRIESAEEENDSSSDANQDFFGIGVEFSSLNKKQVVLRIVDGGSAQAGGVLAKDILEKVDGASLDGKSQEEVMDLIRGPKDSKLTLTVLRDGKEIDFPLQRKQVVLPNVEARVLNDLDNKIGMIKIRSFVDKSACSSVKQKIQDLESKKVSALVLDLRDNGGGLLEQAVCIGGLFVGQQVIVQVKDLKTEKMQALTSTELQRSNLPMVVLVNAGSASASEVLSGALQDYKRAWIVGENSFGKASVQAPSNVDNNKILLWHTIARFYQPLGRTNQVVGIEPSFVVPFKPDASDDERFSVHEKDIFPNALDGLSPPWQETRPDDVKTINACIAKADLAKHLYATQSVSNPAVDYQALAAQEVLQCQGFAPVNITAVADTDVSSDGLIPHELTILDQQAQTYKPDPATCQQDGTCELKEFSFVRMKKRMVLKDTGLPIYMTDTRAIYETDTVANLEKFALVQQIRGCRFSSRKVNGAVEKDLTISRDDFFGQTVVYDHKTWQVDTSNNHPIYTADTYDGKFSNFFLLRWNTDPHSLDAETNKYYGQEKPTIPVVFATDLPGAPQFIPGDTGGFASNSSLEFRTCLFKTADLPDTTDPQGTNIPWDKSIQCFSWDSKFVYDFDSGKYTSPAAIDPVCGVTDQD